MPMMSRAIKLGLLGAIAAALGAVALAFPASGRDVADTRAPAGGLREIVGFNIKNPDYVGRFASRSGQLQMKITERSRSGEALEGLFQPKVIKLVCVGGPPDERRYRAPPLVIYFHDRGRRFEGQNYGLDQFGYESVLLFRGMISRDGARAEGTITYLDNPTQSSGQPYCNADGRLPWDAKRVPGSSSS